MKRANGFIVSFLLLVLLIVSCTNLLDLQNSSSSVTPGKNIESPNIGTLIYVPAGSFQRDGTETNVSVITKPYYLGKFQITRQQFKDVMGTDPSNTSSSSGMDDPVQYVN